ncbi:very long chain fatty acid elongase 7-like isoform X2 [Periplaneta americana]|uniref:very long chain fatty acid elongase 7-like isoform X2 n=1 Tax=Periplaneta americana TaxID=6978 RepID=UPI0037E75331
MIIGTRQNSPFKHVLRPVGGSQQPTWPTSLRRCTARIGSGCTIWLGITFGWGTKLRIFCEPVDPSNKPLAVGMARWVWLLYLTKIFDLFDTVLFILRKKDNQVTFLHVLHHTMTLTVGTYLARITPGGQCVLDASINSFVHMVMYSYYFITNAFPEYKKNIWWKKYITQMQLVQFVFLVVHNIPTVIQKDCGFPALAGGLLLVEGALMFYLFSKFYVKTYWKKKNN